MLEPGATCRVTEETKEAGKGKGLVGEGGGSESGSRIGEFEGVGWEEEAGGGGTAGQTAKLSRSGCVCVLVR